MTPEPGIYWDVAEEDYHGDRGSLSHSGARKLLLPSCPAIFRHEQLHGQPHKRAYDLGHAVHREVLGFGAEVVSLPFDDYKKKDAQTARDQAYAEGKVPLLAREVARAAAMADAVFAHQEAGALFADGDPELSIWWEDEETGVMRRARPDWTTELGGRTVLVDLKKTGKGVDPREIAKSIATYGYFQQHPWYTDAVRAAGLDDNAGFVFVFVSDEPPHLVEVVELEPGDVEIGHALNRRAVDLYARCVATDTWPGYSRGINRIKLPAWVRYHAEEALTDV